MTCIVGFTDVKNNITYLGADSCASNGYSSTKRLDKKVFRVKNTKNTILGFTTSYRMGQLLMYADNLINEKEEINHEYMVTNFIPNLIELFDENNWHNKETNNELEDCGEFLIANNNNLFRIFTDYQVSQSQDNYNACGSGEYFALGSLKTTENMDLKPEERIHLALQSAAKFSVGVAPPFYIINTQNNEMKEFKD